MLSPAYQVLLCVLFFFFNDTATTEIYTLSLHDALPIYAHSYADTDWVGDLNTRCSTTDRKSTRLNSSHLGISYAVFCLKKKKQHKTGMRCVARRSGAVTPSVYTRRL